MSWQSQPQFSAQPGAPFMSPVGQSAPSSAIPPAVFQAAEAAGLGSPFREYNRGANASAGRSAIAIPLILGLAGGGIGLLVGIFVPLLVTPFPFNLIAPAVILVCILPFLPMLIKLVRGVLGGGGASEFRAWGCPEGLVYLEGKQFFAVRWRDISAVWRKVGFVNGLPSTLGYIVQPANAAPFKFSLLTGPYAGLLDMMGNSSGSMSISSGAGVISSQGGFIQVEGMADLSAYAGLGELIEEQILNLYLPQILETFQQGQQIAFGTFLVSSQGLSDGSKNLAWEEIADIQVSAFAIRITKRPADLLWYNLSVPSLPNAALLIGLLNTIRARYRQG